MAISIVVSPGTPSEISPVLRSDRSVSASISVLTDDPGNEVINSVSASLGGISEPIFFITPNASNISITGTYGDPFVDVFTFVSKGSSDKIETPTSVINLNNMPPNKDLFNLNQDDRDKVEKSFTITVLFTSFGVNSVSTLTITQDILNEIEPIRLFVDTYYD